MSYTKKTLLDRVLSMVLTVMMVIAMMPMNVFARESTQYAAVTTLTGGEVKNNGTANVEVVIEEATLNWSEGTVRAEGWWVGIKVEAPEGFSADATYKSKGNPSHAYGKEKKFAEMKDGDSYIEFWIPISTDSLVKFAKEGRNITMMYTFDWDADTNYEQEITFSVVPSEKIVLMKDGEQAYPFKDDYGFVTTLTGGSVKGDGTANVEVTVDKATLTWAEGDDHHAEGWWVGIKAAAPESFSADATYKTKDDPSHEYGAAEKFADMKHGDDYIELWLPISADSLINYANEGRNITMMYAFDWNADSEYEQEITFSVVPSKEIVLMKDGEQVYPVITYDVSVEKNDGGVVKVNGAENATTTVDRNSNVAIAVTANKGYQIASVKIDGEEMAVPAAAAEYSKTLESIKKDARIEVVFVKVYTATVTHDGSGTGISNPANGGSVTVESGKTTDITATPDAGNRVVSVTINGVKDTSVSGANNGGYSKTLTVDKDYTVVITFAPNVYKIEAAESENGTVTIANTTVEHGGNTVVTLSPAQGYTVDTVKVNDTVVDAADIVKGDAGIQFSISDITADKNVVVTYKKVSTAAKSDLTIDSSAALRDNEEDTFFVIKEGTSIVFKTEKAGIKIYNADGVIGGDESTQSVAVDANTVITKVELYYKADAECYDEWHEVVIDDVKIVVDKGDNVTASLVPSPSVNGYHNANVTFTVNAEDTGDYSGLALVEYWITNNGVKGDAKELYKHDTEIKNIFTDNEKLVVDASLYNSADVKVTLRVVDRAGNEKIVEQTLKINSTKPTLSLDITGTKFDNAQDGYFNDKRELTITIADRADTFSKANVAAGLIIKKNGQIIPVDADDIEWTTDTDNLHVGKYVFESDGHYEWSISYENLAGLKNDGVTAPSDKFIYDFYVDKVAPHDLKLTYEPSFPDVVLETLTFGFYKAPVKVTIEAVDDTAEIAQFEYKYAEADITSTITDIKRDGTRAYAEFIIPAQFRDSVSFTATDRAGRSAELSDERVIVVDTIAPGIDVEWTPDAAAASNGKYYNTDRTAKIIIDEANFFAADIEDGLLVITQTMTLDDGTHSETILKPEFQLIDGKYVATVTFDQNADYTFDIKYTDRSGNVYDEYPMDEFTIDKINPVIHVSYDNNTAVNDNQFKAARKATITVIEHNFNADGMVVAVNGSEYQVTWTPVDGEADTYTTEVPFPGDAHYTFSVEGKDYAANGNDDVVYAEGVVAPEEFTVDASGPENLKITYEPTFVGTLLEGLTFGFYKAPVKVTIEATDDVAGIDYFTYSYMVQDGASIVNAGMQDVVADVVGMKTTASATFEIPAQFRGFVSFKATNNADVSSSQADPNVVVVDDIAPGITVAYTNNSVQNGSYYNSDRTATITIEEANFFAADIEDGLLVITRKTVLNDGTVKEETLTPVFTKVENSDVYTATVVFNQDADYTFDIKYTDRAGNTYDSYEMDAFTVDKINPVISIEKANGAYFNADRTAKITVVEHNFRASDFVFTAEAYNVLGKSEANRIDLSSKAYQAYLQNQDNWTKVAADTWEAVITFDIEGNYEIGATYTDLAGNTQVEAIHDTFCVDKPDTDKTDPNNLKITYEPTFVGTLLETITFGFYKAPVKVTIEATDDIAGVDHFVYSYTVQNGASATNEGKRDVTAEAIRDGSTNRWSAEFEIPAQFRGNVSFTAYDKAANHAFLADKSVVVVDDAAPAINVTYSKPNNDDEYLDAQRKAIITITESNFFERDIADGLLVITVEKTTVDGKYTSTVMSPKFTKAGDVYTAEIPFVDAGDYTLDIKYTDRSGNVYDSYEKDVFTVDKTAPVINVSYDNNSAKNGDQFKADRTATIQIIEHNFDPSKVVATVTANGSEVPSYAEHLAKAGSWTKVEGKADTWQAEIKYTKEAHYTFAIACTDTSGNKSTGVEYGESAAPTKFTIDKSVPTMMDIKIGDVSVVGSMETIAFNKFYGEQIVIKLSANCDISGLESLKYQKVADVADYDEDGAWTDYNAESGIVINPSEKLVIYFRAEDRAGNVKIIRSIGIVVDDRMPVGETNAPEIDILPAAPNANGMYKDDVSVDLKVVDPKYAGTAAADNGHYSGLNKITYKIYTTDTGAVEEGTLLDLATKTDGAVFDADKLVSSWSGKIIIDSQKFNSNNVIVEVTAVDNAGNERKTTTKAGDIQIDITAPTIVVSYDNNVADSDSIFKADRTATVVITERNLNAKDVVVKISNTDGVVPTISEFTKKAGTGNGDDSVWTATIQYTADGDYTFDIAYTDLAGNACAGETFVEGTVASDEFTIDKTAPIIEVTYDNNDVQNGNYYKAYRTATVVITEHNFIADRVTITHTATDDGAEIAKPTISGWTTNGDKHTVTISYSKDGKYTFDIAMNDKAGNASADYPRETFIVDTTMPTLEITGVADLSANNGDVIPVITYSDTNYDADKVTITLSGANRKDVELDGAYEDIHNGRTFTFKNLPKEKNIDDIYTLTAALTDKAGNTTEKTITFSVNRFGSTYSLSEAAEKLNGTYVKEPIDVVIAEVNADELSNIKVTLFKDGETTVLKEDTDYKINLEGGNGQWYHYTYNIFAKNFEADGVYSLTVESDDKAGNDAKNDQDTKDAAINFGVDRTLPIINIENLESKTTYAMDNMTVQMSVKDNLKLTKVIVELDGKEIRVWNAEELEEIIKNGGNFSFDIAGDSTDAHKLVAYAIDAAGNGEKISETELPANAEETEDFYVTTNLWVRYYTNKPLFFGSIAGVIVLAALIVFLIVFKKKKSAK